MISNCSLYLGLKRVTQSVVFLCCAHLAKYVSCFVFSAGISLSWCTMVKLAVPFAANYYIDSELGFSQLDSIVGVSGCTEPFFVLSILGLVCHVHDFDGVLYNCCEDGLLTQV